MEENKIRQRSEIPEEDKWAVEDIYPSDEAWEEDLSKLEAEEGPLVAFAGHLNESGHKLYEYLINAERVEELIGKLAGYCMRRADEDTRVAKYQGMVGRFYGAVVAMSAATSFETPEIMAISDEEMDRFYAECPELERFRRYLTDKRRMKAHTLSAAEEKLLAAAGEMAQTPDNIYGMFADADITFEDAVDAEGKTHPLSQSSFVALESGSDRVLRKSAYENLYKGFGAFKNTAAGLLNAQNKQLKFFAEARKYENAFEAALDRTNVPTSVYLNLIEAVHQNMDKMHRYVRLRKKLLGVDELHFYDIYTPLLPADDQKISFAEAQENIMEAVKPLGAEYCATLKEGFEKRWIDKYPNEGKRSGAYSSGVKVHPFVLMNYNDTMNSEFTLAHEMGHAMHSYLSNKTQNTMDASYVIFVAEVASTCNESLLIHHLLNKCSDKKERAYLINHFLDSFKGTIFRQTMFAEFERITHEMSDKGEPLNAEKLCEIYLELNKLYFGPDMISDDEIKYEWARIPHFYSEFYVYQYATGFSAAIALSKRIMELGEEGVKDYMKFLTGGCSLDPIELLKLAGVDMSSPAPIDSALELFGQLVDELENLI